MSDTLEIHPVQEYQLTEADKRVVKEVASKRFSVISFILTIYVSLGVLSYFHRIIHGSSVFRQFVAMGITVSVLFIGSYAWSLFFSFSFRARLFRYMRAFFMMTIIYSCILIFLYLFSFFLPQIFYGPVGQILQLLIVLLLSLSSFYIDTEAYLSGAIKRYRKSAKICESLMKKTEQSKFFCRFGKWCAKRWEKRLQRRRRKLAKTLTAFNSRDIRGYL